MKKFLSCLLTLSLALSLLATAAISEDEVLYSAPVDEIVEAATDFGDTGLTLDDGSEEEFDLDQAVEIGEDAAASDPMALDAVPMDANSAFTVKDGVLTAWTGDSTTKVLAIPDELGIAKIGEACFKGQTGLQTVILPATLTSIEAHAFDGCTGLQQIALDAKLATIGAEAFNGCTSLKAVTLPASVTTVGDHAFYGCKALQTVTIEGSGLKTIDSFAFSGTALQAVTLPKSVATLGKSAFQDVSTLASVTLSEGLTVLEESAFKGTGLKSVAIPASITEIKSSAFEGCAALKEVSFSGSGLAAIGAGAFKDCAALSSVSLPSSVKSIGDSAFANTSGLAAIDLGSGLESIDASAFSKSGIKSVTIPGTAKAVPDSAFAQCPNLQSAVLKDGITAVDGLAFEGCTALTGVVLPDSLTKIGDGAFKGCAALAKIRIPKNVSAIGTDAFSGCAKLTSVYVYKDSVAHQYCVTNKLPFVLTEDAPVQSVTLDKTTLSLSAGETAQLVATVLPENANDQSVTWTTSDSQVAKVNDGMVTAVGAGTATITCISLGDVNKKATCAVTVTGADVTPSPSATVAPSATPAPSPSVNPSASPAPSPSASPSASPEASVSPSPSATAAPSVPEKSVTKTGSNGTVKVNLGEQLRLVPAFATSNGWTVSRYTTSKAKVATVDGSGLVTAVAEGKTKIKIITANKKKATLTIQVVDPYKPAAIAITQGKTATITLGQTLQLTTVLAPSTAKATLAWKSKKTKVATVDGNGLVTPVAEGKTKITVMTHNKKKATITVKVVDPNKPAAIAITQGKTAVLAMGQTLQLTTALSPSTAKATLAWKSSKTKVATVDANGLVTPVGEGKAKIGVMTHNRKKATITVLVVDPNKPAGITISQGKTVTIKVGQTLQLTPTLVPSTAKSALAWRSKKPAIVAVNDQGVVAGLKKGKSKVTVMTYNKKKATITVVVTD